MLQHRRLLGLNLQAARHVGLGLVVALGGLKGAGQVVERMQLQRHVGLRQHGQLSEHLLPLRHGSVELALVLQRMSQVQPCLHQRGLQAQGLAIQGLGLLRLLQQAMQHAQVEQRDVAQRVGGTGRQPGPVQGDGGCYLSLLRQHAGLGHQVGQGQLAHFGAHKTMFRHQTESP